MSEPTTKDRRSLLDARRPARMAVAMAVALVTIAAVSMTTTAASDSASPGASQAIGMTHFDSDWVYSLDLPEGWLPFVASADASGGEDLFEGPDGTSARVGGGAAEPGDTVESRVAANRADLTADGSCESDELADQPTTLGGEPAITWSWRCPNSFHAAINTLGQGMRLRLQVNVPLAAEEQAAAMLESLRQGFAFVGDGDASAEASTDLAALDQRLQGTYENDWYPVELQYATIEAAGLSLDDADQAYLDTFASVNTTRSTVTFEDGVMIQYGAIDGGPLEQWWAAKYTLLDDHTIEATELGEFGSYVYEFTLQDDVLILDVITEDVAQTGLMETLPFTRVP